MNTNRIINLLDNPQYEAIYQTLLKYFDADVLNIIISNLDDNKIFKAYINNGHFMGTSYEKIIIGCNKDKTVFYTADISKSLGKIKIAPDSISVVDYAELVRDIISQTQVDLNNPKKDYDISPEKLKSIIDTYIGHEIQSNK